MVLELKNKVVEEKEFESNIRIPFSILSIL